MYLYHESRYEKLFRSQNIFYRVETLVQLYILVVRASKTVKISKVSRLYFTLRAQAAVNIGRVKHCSAI